MNPANFAVHVELGLEEMTLGNFSEAVGQLRIAEELPDELNPFTAALLAYGYGRMNRTEDAERLFDEYQRLLLSGGSPFLDGTMVWASLAIRDDEQALESLTKLTGSEYGLNLRVHEFRVNSWNDPILEQPEFVAVRSRLGFRE